MLFYLMKPSDNRLMMEHHLQSISSLGIVPGIKVDKGVKGILFVMEKPLQRDWMG